MKARIGMVSQWYDPEGGAASAPGVIARSLLRQGHKVDVVTGFPNYPTGDVYPGYHIRPYVREELDGVSVHRSAIFPSHDAHPVRRAANYLSFSASASAVALTALRSAEAVLVHSSPATAAIPAMALRAVRGIPFVVHIQDLWPQSVLSSGFLSPKRARITGRALDMLCDDIYRRARTIAVTSPGMADAISRRGVPETKIAFVPNWADESVFRPVPRDGSLARALGLERPFTAMYAGNLGTFQAVDSIVEAAALLQDHRDIGFAIVGRGVEESRLKAASRRRRLTNVTFIEPQPFGEMAGVLALGDVQIISLQDLPLFQTTMPSKVQATLAAGRPVIAAVAGDAARVVADSGAGRVVPPGSARAMADAILELRAMSDAELGRLGASGREYYGRTFSESAAATTLSELLEDAASARRGRNR